MLTRTRLGWALCALGFVATLGCARLVGMYRFATLFDEGKIVRNFRSMPRLFDSRVVQRAGPVFEFGRAEQALPAAFPYLGEERDLHDFLERRATTGLLVVKDDRILVERYFQGNEATDRTISWSMGKSFVSALFGIALSEGAIDSIEDPATRYVPELAESGYDGVRLKDILQMSSGIRFTEDYGDPEADINKMGRAIAMGTPIAEYILTLQNERPPGTFHHYVSMDTQVLGMVLAAATGQTLSEYLAEKLWTRMGVDREAYWILDCSGMEWAFGGLNMTLRDFGRFGRLYLRGGDWEGEQLVPAAWVRDSVAPDSPHLLATNTEVRMGYGYQWWIPADDDGEFMALGVYGQFIYVYPKERLIIVKTSADLHFQDDDFEAGRETVAAFRAIARHFADVEVPR